MKSTEAGDALGAALLEAAAGGTGLHFVERDDGLLEAVDASLFFSKPFHWPDPEAKALRKLSGRVLDVGAGAGRHSLVLQDRGCEVTALDISPGAIEVCRSRGVERTFIGSIFDLIEVSDETYDTLILMGNNLALLQSEARAAGMFDAMRTLLAPGGFVVGTCRDPYLTDDPDHLAYQDANRAAGRFPGQIRIRIRYRRAATEWFGLLYLSRDELTAMAGRHGWELVDSSTPDPNYVAILRPLIA